MINKIRRYLIAGLLIWVPLGATILVFLLLLDIMDGVILLLPESLQPEHLFGFNIIWKGEGLNEIGVDKTSGKTVIKVSDRYFRPAEVESLLGDPTKAKQKLGWEPKITFDQLIEDMVLYGQ